MMVYNQMLPYRGKLEKKIGSGILFFVLRSVTYC